MSVHVERSLEVQSRSWLIFVLLAAVQAVLNGAIHAAYVVQPERQKLTQSFRRERPHFQFPVLLLADFEHSFDVRTVPKSYDDD